MLEIGFPVNGSPSTTPMINAEVGPGSDGSLPQAHGLGAEGSGNTGASVSSILLPSLMFFFFVPVVIRVTLPQLEV